MGDSLAQHDLTIDGWPRNVPFPNPNETLPPGKHSKGISDIGNAALKAFVDHILDTENPYPLRFVQYEGPRMGMLGHSPPEWR